MKAIYFDWVLKCINYNELISSLEKNDFIHSVEVQLMMVLICLIYNELC